MSTTIDQRVVEMRFDNKQFESNVQQSLSTIEKLKQKLNLTGASKGLENISKAAKNTNIPLLGDAAERVGLKFNAMYTIADQTLRNITNSVERTAKNMASALTIDPIKTGLQEYETQIGAVQTIMANTSHQGTTLNDVNAALDTLNSYADKTIYNFTEMTRNIGTFTAAGVDLQTSVDSIQGIANLAAVSGSTSQQASTAMYQLSQALAAGKVSLMDWNSVVNAGMGGKVFQDALIRTSELLGTGAKAAIDSYGSFRESLTKGEWLTTEVLTETLKQFAGAYSEADLIAQGFTKEQAKDIAAMAVTAQDAATKVKTMTQLWDTLKEAAQSGWTQTWELIIGDFEEAKELWSGVSDVIGEFINNISNSRNDLLAGALNTPWEKLIEKINEAGIETETFEESVKKVAKDEGVNMDRLIKKYGSFEDACRSGEVSADILNKALENLSGTTADLSKVTDELKMGDSGDQVKEVQQALSDLGYHLDKFGVDGIIGSETEAAIKAFQELEGLEVTGIVDDATLEKLKEAAKTSNELAGTLDGLLNKVTGGDLGGREIIIESLKEAFVSFKLVLKAVSTAYRNIFPKATSEQLLELINKFKKFTESLRMSGETFGKVRRTFEGFFALIDIGVNIVKAFASGIGKALGGGAVGGFLGGILDITAGLGDFIVSIHDALEAGNLFDNIADIIGTAIRKLLDLVSIPADIIAGFVGGLLGGSGDIVGAALELFGKFIQSIRDFLGIHSPSTKFFEIAENCILGLVEGIKAGIGLAVTAVSELAISIIKGIGSVLSNLIGAVGDIGESIGSALSKALGSINWGVLLSGLLGGGSVYISKKLLDIVSAFAKPFEGLGDIFEGVGDVLGGVGKVLNKGARAIKKVLKSVSGLIDDFGNAITRLSKSFSKVLKAKAFDMRASGILKIAGAIAILAASLAILSYMDQGKLREAAVSLSILVVAMGALAFAVSKMTGTMSLMDSAQMSLMGNLLVKIGIAIVLLGATLKLIGGLDDMQVLKGLAAISVFMLFLKVFAEIGATSGKNVSKVGSMLIKLGIAMAIMVGVCKLIGQLNATEIILGITALVIFGGFVAIMANITKDSGDNISKFGSMMLKMSISMLLMVGVIKLLGMMDLPTIAKGLTGMLAFTGIIALLVYIGKSAGQDMPKISGMLLGMSGAMLIMTGVVKLLGMMDIATITKGMIGILAFSGIIALLVYIGKSAGRDLPKVTGALIGMSVAIAILAGVSIVLGLIEIPALAKGIVAVGLLAVILRVMITATRGANNVMGSIIAMAAAIGVMVGAVAILTLIDTDKLITSVTALSILMGAFSLTVKGLKGAQDVWKSLLVMTGAIAVLGGALYLLAQLPIDKTLGTASSLGVLLLALSVSMKLLGNVGAGAMAAMPAMGVLTAVVAGLALILGVMSALELEGSLQTALSLSILLLAMSGAVLILSKVGPMATAAYPAMGALAVLIAGTAVIIAALAGLNSLCGGELLDFLNTGIPILESVGYAIGSFFGNLVDGLMGGGDMSFIESLTTQLESLGDAIGTFAGKITGIDEGAIDSAKNIAQMIALIAGASLIDNINNFITGTSSIESFSTQLSTFGDAIIAFSNKVSGNINEDAVNAAANAGTMLATLQSNIASSGGVFQFFSGEKDLSVFATQISAFGDAIVQFSQKVSGNIDEGAVTAAANAGSVLATLQNNLAPAGGVLQFFSGEKDLSTFASQIVAFGSAITRFSSTVSGNINEEAVTAAANAGTVMSTMQSQLVGTGGVIQWFSGEKDMATFGTQLVAFGNAIVLFSQTVSGNINEEAIMAAANAGSLMASMQENIVPSGGVIQWFSGEKDMATFATQIVAFGNAIVQFSETVAGKIDAEAITAAANAGSIMAELQNALPEGGGWFSDDNTLDDFGKALKKFGSGIADYSEEVVGIDTGAINTSVSAARRLASLANSLTGFDKTGIENFKVKKLGEAIKGYADKVSGIDTGSVSSSISVANRIKNLINSLANLDTSGVSNFQSAVNTLGQTNVSGLTKTFSSASSQLSNVGSDMMSSLTKGMTSKTSSLTSSATNMVSSMTKAISSSGNNFTSSGVTLMANLVKGITSKSSLVKTAVTSAVSRGASAIRSYYTSFHTNGTYLGSGLISGINSKKQAAYDAGYALGKKAAQGVKDGEDAHSPSREGIKAGKWLGEGLIIGIDKMSRSVYNSAKGVGQTAVNAMSTTVSKIASAIDSDIDAQPTIRPVLDLSDVQSGAGTIGNLFNTQHSVGLSANLNAISASMSTRNQNGVNADVVSAIDKLRKELGNIGGTNYNINGVSYSDDAGVANAIKTLVRATVREGRA